VSRTPLSTEARRFVRLVIAAVAEDLHATCRWFDPQSQDSNSMRCAEIALGRLNRLPPAKRLRTMQA
jgi:hypothetical protein